jgi:hypothetical protein
MRIAQLAGELRQLRLASPFSGDEEPRRLAVLMWRGGASHSALADASSAKFHN